MRTWNRNASPRLSCALILSALVVAGCVERKLTVRSEPAGAAVTVDGKAIGETPVTVDFMEYGGREFILSKPGHQRVRQVVRLEPPLYQRLGPDLFFELLWPWTLVDEQVVDFALTPLKPMDSSEPADVSGLESRGRQMQERAESFGK